MARLRLPWRPAEPAAPSLIAFLTLAGAALSPAFFSPDFPPGPGPFGPRAWSLTRALGAALAAAGLAGACGLRPRRMRRSGAAAHLTAGGSILCTMVGGMLSQTGLTQVGFFSAVALSLLGAAMSLVRDFADIPGDRDAGLHTLPVMLGPGRAALAAMAAAVGTWLLTLVLLLNRVGMQPGLYAILLLLLGGHLFVLMQLMHDPAPAYARRAPLLSAAIFTGVTALYVAAQALY